MSSQKPESKTKPERLSATRMIQQSVQWVLIKLVRLYQLTISPWLGPSCRHSPSCSTYMIEAIREWGALKGLWIGLKRLAKCHPWGTSGYDPVPKKKSESDHDTYE